MFNKHEIIIKVEMYNFALHNIHNCMGGGTFRLTMELGGGGHPLCVNNAMPSQTIV